MKNNDNEKRNKDILEMLNTTGRGSVGIGSYVKHSLLNPLTEIGKQNWLLTNSEIALKVIEKFESANTSAACIAWYRNKIKKEFEVGKTEKYEIENL